MDVLLRPGHFRDVHQPLDSRLQLHEGAVIGDVGHAALMHRADRELAFHGIPGVFLQLLHTQADAVRVLVDLDDLHLDRLADRQYLGRMVHPPPGHVGHVQKPVHTAKVHKGTVFGDVLDHAVNDLAFRQVSDDLGPLLGPALLEDRAARDDDVAPAPVHLEDLEGLLQPHQRPGIAHRPYIHLRPRQERHGPAQIDGEAALDPAEDRALDALLALVGLLQTVPGLFPPRHLAADHRLAARILGRTQIDLDLVADLDRRRLARVREFLEIDTAFHLVADVDDGLSRLDGQDPALDDAPFVGRVDFEAFIEEGFEVLHAVHFSAHAVCLSFSSLAGLAVVSAGLCPIASPDGPKTTRVGNPTLLQSHVRGCHPLFDLGPISCTALRSKPPGEERSRLSIRRALPHGMPRPATSDRRTGNQRA